MMTGWDENYGLDGIVDDDKNVSRPEERNRKFGEKEIYVWFTGTGDQLNMETISHFNARVFNQLNGFSAPESEDVLKIFV